MLKEKTTTIYLTVAVFNKEPNHYYNALILLKLFNILALTII